MSEFDNSWKSDLGLIANISLRLILLGGIIFLATTYIPKTELGLDVRITISVVVVLIYSLLGIIGGVLVKIKNKLCSWICGCDPSNYNFTDPNDPNDP